jgi:hypothetical protein
VIAGEGERIARDQDLAIRSQLRGGAGHQRTDGIEAVALGTMHGDAEVFSEPVRAEHGEPERIEVLADFLVEASTAVGRESNTPTETPAQQLDHRRRSLAPIVFERDRHHFTRTTDS